MGSFLDKPKTDKTNQTGEGNQLRYGLSSMQGWRIEMEDSHCAVVSLPIKEFHDWSFFAVFDGHAGAKVSHYCSENLLDSIIKTENSYFSNSNKNSNNNSLNKSPNSKETNYINNSINLSDQKIREAIRQGFLDLDTKIRGLEEFKNGDDKSGSTAVACLISPHFVFLINCGDSRGLLVRNNDVVLKTLDHKPNLPAERDRITKAGGSVMIQRVNGSLAVSRALGDFEYKTNGDMGQTEQLVSPEPDVLSIERDPKDEFVVLACDGIWDVMSNEDIRDFVRDRLRTTDKLDEISNSVLDTCLNKVSLKYFIYKRKKKKTTILPRHTVYVTTWLHKFCCFFFK
jgi:protein phosphatase 1B